MPVSTDNFWQTWTFKTRTGALAFNHADGTLRMVRQPDGNELVAPASPLVPAVAGFSFQSAEMFADPHDRVLAAVRVLPQPPPPPLVDEGVASSLRQPFFKLTVLYGTKVIAVEVRARIQP
jgi:hypothetical protein